MSVRIVSVDGAEMCMDCESELESVVDGIVGCGCEGSPRVKGDDEEEDTDDLDNEFNHNVDIDKHDKQQVVDEMLHSQMAYGRDTDVMMSAMQPQYPLLTDGHTVRKGGSSREFHMQRVGFGVCDLGAPEAPQILRTGRQK